MDGCGALVAASLVLCGLRTRPRRFVGPSRYPNYPDEDDVGELVLAAAYGQNLRRLQSIKAKYDPENVFHVNVNIPPKA